MTFRIDALLPWLLLGKNAVNYETHLTSSDRPGSTVPNASLPRPNRLEQDLNDSRRYASWIYLADRKSS